MKKAHTTVLLISSFLLASCASPSYQGNSDVAAIEKNAAKGTEKVVLTPSRHVMSGGSGNGLQVKVVEDMDDVKAAVAKGDAVVLQPAGTWHLEFDLSQIPPGSVITEATLELHVMNKEVMARSLSLASLTEVAPDIFPNAFYQSSVSLAGGRGVAATDSTFKWKTHPWSAVSWIGGNGGRLVFVGDGPGVDRWNLTTYVKKAQSQKRAFSCYIGLKYDRLTSSENDISILSTKVLVGSMAYYSPTAQQTDSRPQLIVTYQ